MSYVHVEKFLVCASQGNLRNFNFCIFKLRHLSTKISKKYGVLINFGGVFHFKMHVLIYTSQEIQFFKIIP